MHQWFASAPLVAETPTQSILIVVNGILDGSVEMLKEENGEIPLVCVGGLGGYFVT